MGTGSEVLLAGVCAGVLWGLPFSTTSSVAFLEKSLMFGQAQMPESFDERIDEACNGGLILGMYEHGIWLDQTMMERKTRDSVDFYSNSLQPIVSRDFFGRKFVGGY